MKSLPTHKFPQFLLIVSSLILSGNLMANSCNKSDIEYYLQKGFNHDQVIQLCSTPNAVQNTAPVSRPAISNTASNYNVTSHIPNARYQPNKINEDQVLLATSLKASNVKLTPQTLSYDAKECIEDGPVNNLDLLNEVCVKTRVTINMSGLKVLKSSKGIFLIKDAQMLVQGNIQREFLNLNTLRRQERTEITSLLSTRPSQINIPTKKGIDPTIVAEKIKQYSR